MASRVYFVRDGTEVEVCAPPEVHRETTVNELLLLVGDVVRSTAASR